MPLSQTSNSASTKHHRRRDANPPAPRCPLSPRRQQQRPADTRPQKWDRRRKARVIDPYLLSIVELLRPFVTLAAAEEDDESFRHAVRVAARHIDDEPGLMYIVRRVLIRALRLTTHVNDPPIVWKLARELRPSIIPNSLATGQPPDPPPNWQQTPVMRRGGRVYR
jgi:hypothetical protein